MLGWRGPALGVRAGTLSGQLSFFRSTRQTLSEFFNGSTNRLNFGAGRYRRELSYTLQVFPKLKVRLKSLALLERGRIKLSWVLAGHLHCFLKSAYTTA
jgi:hypothetical protein